MYQYQLNQWLLQVLRLRWYQIELHQDFDGNQRHEGIQSRLGWIQMGRSPKMGLQASVGISALCAVPQFGHVNSALVITPTAPPLTAVSQSLDAVLLASVFAPYKEFGRPVLFPMNLDHPGLGNSLA